jgi:hypothetical protein
MPNKKEREAYGDLLYQHRPTIRSLLLKILQEKYFNLKRTKESFYVDSAAFVPKEDLIGQLPLKYLAVVSDNEVVEMIRLNEQTAKVMLSKKTKLVEFDPTTTIVKKGMVFANKKFVEKQVTNNAEESNEI